MNKNKFTIKAIKTPMKYAQGLVPLYWHWLPKWMIFILFIKRGFFNGHSKTNWKRIFCWFGKHKWNPHKYFKWENQKETKMYTHQCRRCCISSREYLSLS